MPISLINPTTPTKSLILSDITLTDLDHVDAILYALGLPTPDRRLACRTILTAGTYSLTDTQDKITFQFNQ